MGREEKVKLAMKVLDQLDHVRCQEKLDILAILVGGVIRHLAVDHTKEGADRQLVALEITKTVLGKIVSMIEPSTLEKESPTVDCPTPTVFH